VQTNQGVASSREQNLSGRTNQERDINSLKREASAVSSLQGVQLTGDCVQDDFLW